MIKCLKVVVIAILLMLFHRVLLRTPVEQVLLIVEAFVLVCLVGFYVKLVVIKSFLLRKLNSLDVLTLVMTIIPVWSAIVASGEFGQPFIYGLLAQRDFMFVVSGLWIYQLLSSRSITLMELESSFVVAAWICLIVFGVLSLVIDPTVFFKSGDSTFVGYNELKGGYVFRFVVSLLIFGVIYYLALYLDDKKLTHLVMSLLFFFYLVFVRQDRTIIISTMLGCIYLLNKKTRLNEKLLLILMGIPLLLVLFGVVAAFLPEQFERFSTMFYNMIELIMGESTREASVDVRAVEFAIAMRFIKDNLWLGSGELSHQWNDGFEGLLGYFYPSDIGVVGVVFTIGVFGLLLLYIQYWFAYIIFRKINLRYCSSFIAGIAGTCLAYFLDSLSSGQVLFFSASSMIMISILYYVYRKQPQGPRY